VKRWIVILLVVAAVVLLVSPGIVGHLAEKNLQQNIDWAETEAPQLRVTTESFDRGWFASEGRHRISLRGTSIISPRNESASIVIETRVDHGLVAISSMSRDGGSLEPGLAQAVSTFHLDTGDGELVELPGKAFSRVSLSGITNVQYLLEQGSHEADGLVAEWSGADISLTIDSGGHSLAIDGIVQSLTVQSDNDTASIGGIEIRGTERQTDYGLSVGAVDLTAGPVHFGSADGVTGGFSEMRVVGETRLEGEQVNMDFTMSVGGVTAPAIGELGMDIAVSANGLDAESLGRISTALNASKSSNDPGRAMAQLYPLIKNDLQSLLSAGATVNIERFNLSLPQGDITSKLSVSVDESDAGAAFSWPALALLMTASADISMPEILVDMMLMMNPQADAIRQMGLLRKNGAAYEVQAEFAQGLLTVNGAPFPIPLYGF
jgi:uncharacterized protein YdgA (DUF945 family)